jgi:hypothetical protein
MSILYKIRETLCADARGCGPDGEPRAGGGRNPAAGAVLAGMQRRLAALGARMLLGDADVFVEQLVLSADGETTEFSGDTVTADYQHIVRRLETAAHAELTLAFRFVSHGDPDLLESPARTAAEALCRAADEQDLPRKIALEGVLYRFWYTTDLSSPEGYTSSFGC